MALPPTINFRQPPRSTAQKRRLFTNDKIKSFTKQQIQAYIETFFSEEGINRDLLQAVSPRFLHYNIDKSFDPSLDPTQRKMQIARYFNELKSIIPAILIADGGVEPILPTLGQIDSALVDGNTWRGYYPIVRNIPLTIIAAARDVDEADEMAGILSLMFNEMRNLACGHYMTGNQEEGENWTIVLPNTPVNISALSDVDVEGDPIEKIWYSEAEVNVMFQDVLGVKQDIPSFQFNTVVTGKSALSALPPIIQIPDTISLNEQTTVLVRNFQVHYRITLSDPKKATISYDQILTPRGLGKLKVRVVDSREHYLSPKAVLAEKEIEIV